MKYLIITWLIFLTTGCREEPDQTNSVPEPEEEPKKAALLTVTYKTPPISMDDLMIILWQRSYPEAYENLVKRVLEPDPFLEPPKVPIEKLHPGVFGIVGWGRGCVAGTFDQLGYPYSETPGAYATWSDKTFKVHHSPEAIEAFENRFPEIAAGKQDIPINPFMIK